MEITQAQFKEFKRLYKLAIEQGDEQFIFMERTVLTQYAGYVVQAMEAK